MKLDDGTTKASLTFTTVNAGEYANNYTINLRYSKNAADTTAKWSDNGLTISVCPGATVADIQAAVDKAAGSNESISLRLQVRTGTLRTAHLKRFLPQTAR